MKSDESEAVPVPTIRPSPLELGVTYEGAILEGSLHIGPAKEIRKVTLHEGNHRFVRDGVKEEMHIDDFDTPRFIELSQAGKSGQGGLIWNFRLTAKEPTNLFARVRFDTDRGSTVTHFALEIREGPPPAGKLLFCDSPFDAYSDHHTHANLKLVARELAVQINATHKLPADLSPFRCLVLHGGGLHALVQPERDVVRNFLESSGRVVILANHFFRETVMWANHLTEPYGIHLEDREYHEVLCDRPQIADHFFTEGVQRLRWFRPSPMTVTAAARLLVRNPDRPGEGIVACGGPQENLVVVGESLLSSLLCQGWPFDNGQLFANLLRAGQ